MNHFRSLTTLARSGEIESPRCSKSLPVLAIGTRLPGSTPDQAPAPVWRARCHRIARRRALDFQKVLIRGADQRCACGREAPARRGRGLARPACLVGASASSSPTATDAPGGAVRSASQSASGLPALRDISLMPCITETGFAGEIASAASTWMGQALAVMRRQTIVQASR